MNPPRTSEELARRVELAPKQTTSLGAGILGQAAPLPLLSSYESQQVGVDRFRLRGRHPVGEALVGLERSVLQESCGADRQ